MKKVIKASSSERFEFVVRGKTWNEVIKKMKDLGFVVDSAYRKCLEDVVPFYHGKACWLCEVTQYSNGDYEIRSDNMRRDAYFEDTDNIEECDKITAAYADDDLLDDEYDEYDQYSDWEQLATKRVEDSDGFMTDYTLYVYTEDPDNVDGLIYICMFGDKNSCIPDEGYSDWSGETEEEAWEWFDNYEPEYED